MIVVIPSVHYADMLKVILPAWWSVLPYGSLLRVVTSPDDKATQAVAADFGARVRVTRAWTRGGSRFNKAEALDETFGFGHPDGPRAGEICLSIDADVYPVGGKLPTEIEPDTLYGCPRYICDDADTLRAVARGDLAVEQLRRRNSGTCGGGYFQLFRYRPGLRFGSFPTAGHYDIAFAKQFARVVDLAPFAVLHLGPTSSKNWHGRRTVPQWVSA